MKQPRQHILSAYLIIFIVGQLLPLEAGASGGGVGDKCPVVKIEAERLPDMNIPRRGHSVFYANGELTVVGGHTRGFRLTPTAEYFSDGKWHIVETAYSHDFGLSLQLSNGEVLLAGGCEKNLGIGQSFEVELYDPVTHTTEGFGCLAQKRALASAARINDSLVVISGNWYGNDIIEVFDGKQRFTPTKAVSTARSLPYILPIGDDDALIFGAQDTQGAEFDTIVVDRLKGESFVPSLLQSYTPRTFEAEHGSDAFFIGDAEQGEYAYLIPVFKNNNELAIAEVRDTMFTLLQTVQEIPQVGLDGTPIAYCSHVIADQLAHRAFIIGSDEARRCYVLAIDYAQRPAPLMLYYTDPTEDFCFGPPVLSPEGDLVLTGGFIDNNFKPYASVFKLPVGRGSALTSASSGWVWLLAGLLLFAVCALFLFYRKRAHRRPKPVADDAEAEDADCQQMASSDSSDSLMAEVERVIVEKQLFLRPDIKLSDISNELQTNVRYISYSINSQRGMSFTNLINKYRIDYAIKLMQREPEKKISQICFESGFASEAPFYRIFKQITGLSPKDWREKNSINS